MRRRFFAGMITALCIISLLVCQGCQEKSEEKRTFSGGVVRWGTEYPVPEGFQERWDDTLEELGIDIQVIFEQYDTTSFFETGELPDFAGLDVVSLPWDSIYKQNYPTLAREGKLLGWEDYLAGDGNEFYDSLPAAYWDSLRVDGTIYGLMEPSLYTRSYIAFNTKLLEKYQLSVEGLDGRSCLEMAEFVSEKEKEQGNEKLFALEQLQISRISGMEELKSMSGIAVRKEGDGWKAELYLDDPEFQEQLQYMNEAYHKGVVGYDAEERANGNFFMIMVLAYSEEDALDQLNAYGEYEYTIIAAPQWDPLCRGSGRRTVIMSDSDNAQGALLLLQAVAEHEELGERLAELGIRDNHLTYQELRECFADFPVSELNGFYVDPSGFSEKWEALIDNYRMHQEFYYGFSEDPEKEEAAIREELEQIGISEILDEINRQLSVFQEGK